MKRRLLFYILTILFFGVHVLSAQPFTVKAKMDSTQLWIGEQTGLTFEIVQSPNQKVTTPIFSDTIVGNLEGIET